MSRKLYNYKQRNNLKTTLDIGEITPVYWNYLEPGEKIKNLSFKNLSRMITPVLPTMDNPYVDIYAFAVPKRIIIPFSNLSNPNDLGYYALPSSSSDNLSNWLFKINPANTQEKAIEYFNASNVIQKDYLPNPAIYNAEKTLMSSFGFTPVKDGNSFVLNKDARIDLMYLFAYKKIYYDFFKHKQLERMTYEDWMNRVLGPNGIRIPNVSNEANKYDYAATWDSGTTYRKLEPWNYLNRLNICNVDNEILDELQFENYQLDNILKSSPSTIFNFNNFKRNIFDKFMQNDKILHKIDYGTQKDILLKIWNTDNGDKTNVKLIGFEKYNQVIKQVINQSKGTTLSQSLGEVGGMSVVFNEGHLVNEFTATEPTYIMVVAVPNYKLTFNNVYPYNEWITTKEAFTKYNPEVDYAQDTFNTSCILGRSVTEANSYNLGFQRPFEWMRKKSDMIAGEINNYWSEWTYSVPFPSDLENLSLSVLKTQKPPFKNTLTVPTQDAFIQEWEFKADLKRTIKPSYIIESELIKGE